MTSAQHEQFGSQRLLPGIAHFTLLAVVYLLVHDTRAATLFAPWAGLVTLMILFRAVIWGRLAQLPARRVAFLVRATMLVLGLTWGIGIALATRWLPEPARALLHLGLAGLLAGALTTLMSDRWAFAIYALALVVPVVLGEMAWGRGLHRNIEIALILMYAVFTTRLHAQAYAMLRQRLEMARQLASAQGIAHVGSWEWDIATNRVTWSDELRRMYGLSHDAPAGYREFLATAHPDDRARLERIVTESLTTGKSTEYEWRVIHPDGSVHFIQGRNIVIKNENGKIVGMAGTSLDITARVIAEENQRTLTRELQKAVTEVRTLRGILPICASCKRIRGEGGTWEQMELYVRNHTNAEFSHGLCPDCAAREWGGSGSP